MDLREVFNAILWITRIGAQWRNLDSSFPKWTAVYYYFYRWSRLGLIEQIDLFPKLRVHLKLGDFG